MIEPIKDAVQNADEIVFVPHSFLHYFPLHLLELSPDDTKNENENKEKSIDPNININTDLQFNLCL